MQASVEGGEVVLVVEHECRSVAAQTAAPPVVSAQAMQTDEQVVEVGRRSYASVAAQSDPVPTYDNGSSGGPGGPPGRLGLPLFGTWAVVVHGVSCRWSVAEIL